MVVEAFSFYVFVFKNYYPTVCCILCVHDVFGYIDELHFLFLWSCTSALEPYFVKVFNDIFKGIVFFIATVGGTRIGGWGTNLDSASSKSIP
tara:strand:+ start:816 stop:1091 length:276 start_codon:yes stop_codon:yes gene_type:complete